MPDELGRYGSHEQRTLLRQVPKEVFDLTNCSIDEVIALQRKHGSICGSIRIAQAAAVAASLSAAACTEGIPTRTTGAPQVSHQKDGSPFDVTNGYIMPIEKAERSEHEVVLAGAICPPEQLEKEKDE